MRRQLMATGMTTALLLSACGNGDASTDAAENEDTTAAEEASGNGQTEITTEQQASLDEQFNGMAQDELINSIEPQNEDYSEIIIMMSEEAVSMNDNALEGKMRGTGESIRNSTAGILHDGADDKLPLVEFENSDGEVIAHYDSHERNADLLMD